MPKPPARRPRPGRAPARTEATLESGVAVAVVKENKDDSGLGRVKVTYPWHSQPHESFWARVATPMAGKGRGIYFIPEVEDEVLVAFERGDLRFPYVVGSLWNGKDQAPQSNSDGKNDIRQIKTRKGHKLTFNDGSKGLVQLELNDGKKLAIDDDGISVDDGKGNSIVIKSNSGSITIQAVAELAIKAPTSQSRRAARSTSSPAATSRSAARSSRSTEGHMGQPAARVGDMTSHGTPLAPGPGCPTVLIAGQPAWRAGADVHACPLVSGVQPHVGGTVAVGSPTVLIGGLPAARVGDTIIEPGGPNAIAAGALTVLIG